MTRAERRRLRRELLEANARCVHCDAPIDEHGHRGLWVPPHGDPVPHYLCASCFATASSSRASFDEIAGRVALAFCEPGGHA